jgi:glycosyltransferase involved in cell wall biosynthesis
LKKILFIVPYPAGSAPSQRFRFEQYFSILKESGFHIRVSSFWSSSAWQMLYTEGHGFEKTGHLTKGMIKRLLLLFSVHKYDFIFIHREALPVGPPVLEFVISKILGKKIIYDFDDAIWLPNTSAQNSVATKLKWYSKVKNICSWSWKVSCGNKYLAHFAGRYNNQVTVNPTTIDTDYHYPRPRNSEKVVIGWTGTHSTSKYLQPMTKVLMDLKNRYDFSVKIISNMRPDWDYDDFEFVPWSIDDEIETLNSIDVGIMPLEDSVWEKGKCGFKALQYMALEIPAVASAVGANNLIIDHGTNGFLCHNDQDWINYLSQLISDGKLRKDIGKQGRKKVMEHYSTVSNTRLFLSLFE